MLTALPRLGPAVVRHVLAYGELAADEAHLASRVIGRQLAGLVLAVVLGSIAVLLACAWLIALSWDGPYRSWTIAGLSALFGSIAISLGLANRPGARPGRPVLFARLRGEWAEDRKIIAAQFARPTKDARRGQP